MPFSFSVARAARTVSISFAAALVLMASSCSTPESRARGVLACSADGNWDLFMNFPELAMTEELPPADVTGLQCAIAQSVLDAGYEYYTTLDLVLSYRRGDPKFTAVNVLAFSDPASTPTALRSASADAERTCTVQPRPYRAIEDPTTCD